MEEQKKLFQENGKEIIPQQEVFPVSGWQDGYEKAEKAVAQIQEREEDIEAVIQKAEKQVKVLEKVLAIAIKRTTHYDWVDQQGKPYLMASGAEKIMPLFGVNLTDISYEKSVSSDENGQYYLYKYKGTFFWKGGSIEAIGTCSSRDKFFGWDSRKKAYKLFAEIDESNIMKAAYSNMIVNGVTRLLGIRNLTWEQLERFGIDREKVAQIEYNKKEEGNEEEEKKQKEIEQMLAQLTKGNKELAREYLKKITSFTAKDGKKVEGVDTVKKLTGTRLNIAYNKIKKEYEKNGGNNEHSNKR